MEAGELPWDRDARPPPGRRGGERRASEFAAAPRRSGPGNREARSRDGPAEGPVMGTGSGALCESRLASPGPPCILRVQAGSRRVAAAAAPGRRD